MTGITASTPAPVAFTDGAAYERFMGRASRAVGAIFLDWVAPPKGARWLDVGCGTGAFTEVVLDTCAPAAISAVDPAPDQIDYVRQQPVAQRADFRMADAQALPFADGAFDVVASALVINFIPDRPRAIAEMRRIARPGAIVAGYVWDFANQRGTNWPLGRGMKAIGMEIPRVPGAEDSTVDALGALFARAGLTEIATRAIDVTLSYPGFDDYWTSQTPPFSPLGRVIAAMPDATRGKLQEMVRGIVPIAADGHVSYSARANAVKARAPG
jgi:SAM-dependent methyltransferase